jgi:hydrogenase nickel incorporation protein HypB
MCTTCGCGKGESRIEGQDTHTHHHDHDHEHSHGHSHDHGHDHHHYGHGPAHAHAPGMSQSRMVQIEQDILGKNNEYANANRIFFSNNGILTLNLVSSPGSGKTTLLVRTLQDLKDDVALTVIEGDQETSHDADRIRETGASAIQINTGKGCHLDAHQIGHALEQLEPEDSSVVMIENVGNLVCPSAFDLGEGLRVAVISTTEGDDKPLKYPAMFRSSNVMVINKIDLLPYTDFDVEKVIGHAMSLNPKIRTLETSCRTGEGLDGWSEFVRSFARKTAGKEENENI